MSSRKERSRRGSGSGSGSGRLRYPTDWSAWEYDATRQCHVRYRLTSPGVYDYDSWQPPASATSVTPNMALGTIPEQQYYEYTVSASGSLSQGLNNMSLTSTTIPRSLPLPSPQDSTYIRTRDENTTTEKFDPHYKVHKGWEFAWGKVFKVLWTEPEGQDSLSAWDSRQTMSVRSGKYGEKHYEKVRRFVIVDSKKGHCLCLPIMTYSGQGVNKKGVHAEDHTIIWTEQPVELAGEKEKGLHRKPIRVEPTSARHKLDPASRLNYAKVYTVECNVKVWFIGKIHAKSEHQLTADYNKVHPLMPPRGSPQPDGADDVYEHATGGTEATYPTPYSYANASAAPYYQTEGEDQPNNPYDETQHYD